MRAWPMSRPANASWKQVDDAETEASGEYSAPKGELVVAAPIVFGRMHVLPVVSDFLKSFPESLTRNELSDFSHLWLVGVASNDGATRCRGLKSPAASIGATG